MNKIELAGILNYAAVFEHVEVSEMMVDVWHEQIGHLDAKRGQAAVKLFFSAPLPSYGAKPKFDPREFKYWYGRAREEEETYNSRARAGIFGLEAAKAAFALERKEQHRELPE